MKAIYTRFFEVHSIDAANFRAAETWLNTQEDEGEIFAVGVCDEETKILHVPDNRPEGFGADERFNGYVEDLKTQGIEVVRIEFYATHGGKDQYPGICAPVEHK